MKRPKPCDYCGAEYHQPYDDGLVECRERLREQLSEVQDANDLLRERVRFHAINIEPFDRGRGEQTWIGCAECNSAWPEGDPEGHENGCPAAPHKGAAK